LVARLTRCGRSIAISGTAPRQHGHDDLVDLLAAGELVDRIDAEWVDDDDLAVSLRAGLVKPGQLLLQAPSARVLAIL
jgi:hypothetical protein